jgi:hypothetical protein
MKQQYVVRGGKWGDRERPDRHFPEPLGRHRWSGGCEADLPTPGGPRRSTLLLELAGVGGRSPT